MVFALAVMAVQAAMLGRHVNISLREANIPVEQTPQYFSKWVNVNSKTTFTLVKDETDEQGYRHQRYVQQYGGITVDASCLIVHSKNGKITSVNGFVMETGAAPAKQMPKRVRAQGEQDVVLVETPHGFVYAAKSIDPKRQEIVYTDVETGQVVKRQSMTFHFDGQKKAKGTSYYYGEREMDVTQLTDGRYIMADSVRKIYTFDAANTPDILPDKYKNASMADPEGGVFYYPDSANCKKYFDEMIQVAQTKRSSFKMQELARLDFDLSVAGKEKMGYDFYYLNIKTGDLSLRILTGVLDFPKTVYPDKEKTIFFDVYNKMRLNDTDTTYVELSDGKKVLDVLKIAPSADGGDANVRVTGEKGYLTVDATLKAIGNYAVDVHWGMQHVYDFYKNVLGRNSYDNCGSSIINVVNPRHVGDADNVLVNMEEPNAYATHFSMPRMVYGRGSLAHQSDEQVELSTMGHEFTHLMTWKTADLDTSGEPGSLNEGFSDIFGAAIVNKVLNADGKLSLDYVYAIGQDCESKQKGGCMRLMKNPWVKENPKALEGKYWIDPLDQENDYGGIHINCNVLTFWFYLLSEGFQPGRDALDDTVVDPEFVASANSTGWKGIGIDKSIKIVYCMLTHYLYKNADFRAAMNLSKDAAKELGYDENSEEYKTMMKCWRAVTPAGWIEAVSLTGALDFSFTAKTLKAFQDNSSKLVDYTGQDVNSGVIELTGTFTLYSADLLRSLTTTVPKYLPAVCTVLTLSGDSRNYDFSDGLKDFIGKVLANPATPFGYTQSYTMTDTVNCGGNAVVKTVIPTLQIFKTDPLVINEAATTFIDDGKTTVAADDTIKIRIQMNSGYPIKVAPNDVTGETVYFNLYSVGPDGKETHLSENSFEEGFNFNKAYQASSSTYYVEWFNYVYPRAKESDDDPAVTLAAGTYHLKVSSTWAALSNATFTITVSSSTGIHSVGLSGESDVDVWYDLSGRRLSGKPAAKGLYICNGRKISIR